MKGWQSCGGVLGEVTGGFNPLLHPPALLRSPVLQPPTLRPLGALRKDVTIAPHISRVLPNISKVLFSGPLLTLFWKGDCLSQPNPALLPKIWN